MTVAESALNVACAGARPVALVNCLNFGNPEHPEVMWQLSESIDGMAEACLALQTPVIGGNVSLYNASAGTDIDPTPGGGGARRDRRSRAPAAGHGASYRGRRSCSWATPTRRWPGSRWAVERHGQRGGTLPGLDLAAHARLLALLDDAWSPPKACSPRSTTSRAGGWRWRWPRARCVRGWAAPSTACTDLAELFSESSSRVVLGTTRPRRRAGPGRRRRGAGARHRVDGRGPDRGRRSARPGRGRCRPRRGAPLSPAR